MNLSSIYCILCLHGNHIYPFALVPHHNAHKLERARFLTAPSRNSIRATPTSSAGPVLNTATTCCMLYTCREPLALLAFWHDRDPAHEDMSSQRRILGWLSSWSSRVRAVVAPDDNGMTLVVRGNMINAVGGLGFSQPTICLLHYSTNTDFD